jgi:hypothetical protein
VELPRAAKEQAGGEGVKVRVVVRWEASVWKPPRPKSERIILDAYQTWTVRRSPRSGKPIIASYVVDRLEYAQGSATL